MPRQDPQAPVGPETLAGGYRASGERKFGPQRPPQARFEAFTPPALGRKRPSRPCKPVVDLAICASIFGQRRPSNTGG